MEKASILSANLTACILYIIVNSMCLLNGSGEQFIVLVEKVTASMICYSLLLIMYDLGLEDREEFLPSPTNGIFSMYEKQPVSDSVTCKPLVGMNFYVYV